MRGVVSGRPSGRPTFVIRRWSSLLKKPGSACSTRRDANFPTRRCGPGSNRPCRSHSRSEEHTSELQSRSDLVCRLLLEKKKIHTQLQHPLEKLYSYYNTQHCLTETYL